MGSKRVTLFWFVLWVIFIESANLCAAGDKRLSSGMPFPRLKRDLVSTNGAVRFVLAEDLALDHSKETFSALLRLLRDKNGDISYAAAESVEARADSLFADELITAIRALPRDKQWPAYRAAGKYPVPHIFTFLTECLGKEIRVQLRSSAFDSRNCFYLARSLEQVARGLKRNIKPAPPENAKLQAYQSFLDSVLRVRPAK